MTNEPSPRPWHEDNYCVYDANGKIVAAISSTTDNTNAALIVDAVNERDRLRDLVRSLVEYAEAVTGYRPRTIEIISSEHPARTFDGASLLREARAAIGGETE